MLIHVSLCDGADQEETEVRVSTARVDGRTVGKMAHRIVLAPLYGHPLSQPCHLNATINTTTTNTTNTVPPRYQP
jgi:hypothetical protein